MSDFLSGIARDSVKGTGGIYEVYICLLSDIGSGVTISGLTVSNLGTSAGVWKKYVLGKESGSNFVGTGTGNPANGSYQSEQVLTMIFKRNQIAKRNELKAMRKNELVCVINDNSYSGTTNDDGNVGNLYIIGLQVNKDFGGCDVTSSTIATGAQFADANNMTVVIRALESHEPLTISDSDFQLIRSGSALS